MKHAKWYDYENKKRIDGEWPDVGELVEFSLYMNEWFEQGIVIGFDGFDLADGCLCSGLVLRCGSMYDFKDKSETYFRPIDWNYAELEAERLARRKSSIQRAIEAGADIPTAEKLYDAGLLVE